MNVYPLAEQVARMETWTDKHGALELTRLDRQQVGEADLFRVVVVAERKRVARIKPAEVGDAAIKGPAQFERVGLRSGGPLSTVPGRRGFGDALTEEARGFKVARQRALLGTRIRGRLGHRAGKRGQPVHIGVDDIFRTATGRSVNWICHGTNDRNWPFAETVGTPG